MSRWRLNVELVSYSHPASDEESRISIFNPSGTRKELIKSLSEHFDLSVYDFSPIDDCNYILMIWGGSHLHIYPSHPQHAVDSKRFRRFINGLWKALKLFAAHQQ